MKRIDSVNARANANGAGKAGFSDNADLPGQDATYLTPDWLNHIQEELANLLEKNGVALDPNNREQLFGLLATKADLASAGGLGVNQNWVDVTANRTINTLYTNTTGKPIQIYLNFSFADQQSIFKLNGLDVIVIDGNDYNSFAAIIPNGQTYGVFDSSNGIVSWVELR